MPLIHSISNLHGGRSSPELNSTYLPAETLPGTLPKLDQEDSAETLPGTLPKLDQEDSSETLPGNLPGLWPDFTSGPQPTKTLPKAATGGLLSRSRPLSSRRTRPLSGHRSRLFSVAFPLPSGDLLSVFQRPSIGPEIVYGFLTLNVYRFF